MSSRSDFPTVSSDDVLSALGLARKPAVSQLSLALGFALAGALAGAGAVLLHAMRLGGQKTTP